MGTWAPWLHQGSAEHPPGPGQHRVPRPGAEPCSAVGHSPRKNMKEEIPGISKLISRGANPERRRLASLPAPGAQPNCDPRCWQLEEVS